MFTSILLCDQVHVYFGLIHRYGYAISDIILVVQSRNMKMTGNVARIWKKKNVYGILVGKLKGKKLLGRNSITLGVNEETELNEMWRDSGGWIQVG